MNFNVDAHTLSLVFGAIAVIAGIYAPYSQMRKCMKYGSARGTSKKSIISWGIDKGASLLSLLCMGFSVLAVKYVLGLLFVCVIIFYKFRKGGKR